VCVRCRQRGCNGGATTGCAGEMIHKDLPLLKPGNHKETSPASPFYNCIAWAAGEIDVVWWPDQGLQAYWPPGVVRAESIDAFVAAYATKGYQACADGELVRGIEKVAIYALNGVPTHAARQLPSGNWTSKLGPQVDVEHYTLGCLEGGLYGYVVKYLSRARQPSVEPPRGAPAKAKPPITLVSRARIRAAMPPLR
jgi:hypothetical protein